MATGNTGIGGDDSLAKDKTLGLLWGLVVGDCLGSSIQFMGKDNHPWITEMVPCDIFETPPGYWTNDSSMAVSKYASREECNNSGWCVSTLESALWALNTTSSFEEALVAAVNLGGDADSIGAVCGQLAGAKYGFQAIPKRWVSSIKDRGKIERLFKKFLTALQP